MNNSLSEDIIIKKLISYAEEIVNKKTKDSLTLAQTALKIYEYLPNSDLSQDELWKKYSSFLGIQDDLDYAGIPVREDVRKRWNQNALREQEAELEKIVNSYRNSLIKDSEKLIEEFEKKK